MSQTPIAGNPIAGHSLTPDERTWGLVAHVSGLIGFLGPLIVWLIKKDESAFVEGEARESLNFQITVTLAAIPCAILILLCIGVFLLMALWVASVVFIIMGAIKANEGIPYRYPVSLRLISKMSPAPPPQAPSA